MKATEIKATETLKEANDQFDRALAARRAGRANHFVVAKALSMIDLHMHARAEKAEAEYYAGMAR